MKRLQKKHSTSLEDVLKKVLKKIDRRRPSEEEIEEAWAGAVGDTAARHSRPISLNKGVLTVSVDGSAWLYELSLGKRKSLMKLADLLQKKKIEDIRFRIGDVTHQQTDNK